MPELSGTVPAWVGEMRLADLVAVTAIERASFADPWRLGTFVGEFRNRQAERLVVRAAGHVVAFAICWLYADELHVHDVAVHPAHRRAGHARTLLRTVIDRARRAGARSAHLEVRASNLAAMALYEGLGFRKVRRRKRYYGDNEDAWLYRAEVDET